MTEDVVIVGAGPTGLMLAGELLLAGVRPVVLDRLPEPACQTKALGILGRAVDMLDYRGLLDRFSAHAPAGPTGFAHFGMIPLDLSGIDDLRGVFVRQPDTERILLDRARELGADIRRGHEVTGLRQDRDGVTLDIRGGTPLRARYVVGCDGGGSTVRTLAGIDFPGLPPTRLLRLAEVELPDGPTSGATFVPLGSGVYRVVTSEPYPPGFDRSTPMTLDELRTSMGGHDLTIGAVHWLSRFTDASRQAERYRADRVLLAGDAAHTHLPAGGPGLNTGLLDAVNLGWKLAAQVHGWAPPTLLDTYHTERHPEGARVLLHTRAQAALISDGQHTPALREVMGRLLRHEHAVREVVNLMYALDTRYDTPAGGTHPLLGRWMPDLALTATGGPTRVAELLRTPTAVLLDLTPDRGYAAEVTGWRDRLEVVTAHCADPPADAFLIRPDGHVAWTAGTPPHEALHTWLGRPR
jgi:2-polyprenyl-6-methoxyphenol hydroxylase-like FAD-dependent oxidoreductase